ncbi:MAG: hypothetical protein M8349_02845 [ANME-2 cluster archaeon]|nr:hypothetical protein [ANME-2 cluster archaeon]
MTDRPKNETKITVMNNKNIVEDIYFKECHHCSENIPVVGTCTTCGTDYIHIRTFENYETGFLHFVYTCSGCPEDHRKAQKMVKIYEGNGNGDATSKAHELAQNFLY